MFPYFPEIELENIHTREQNHYHSILHLQTARVDIQQLEPLSLLPAVLGVHFDVIAYKKGNTSDLIFLQHFQELLTILDSVLALQTVSLFLATPWGA